MHRHKLYNADISESLDELERANKELMNAELMLSEG